MNYSVLIAEKLLQIKAIKLSPQKPFIWASGIKSPIYCDNRITLSYPKIRTLVKHGFKELSSYYPGVNTIAGVATAGIAHGVLLADELDLPYIYVRSSAKSHGRQNLIEGQLPENSKILLIEDLISTGGSSIKAANALRDAGAEVLSVLAIFTYEFEQASKNFQKENLTFDTISNYSTLLSIAEKGQYISASDRNVLDKWNADPTNWYSNNFSE
jgi:orotate phosphoribosyltransferase